MSALIIEALRSPRGRGNDKGALRSLKPVQLLASQFSALAERTGLDTGLVEDVFVGCVTQTGEQGAHIGKLALIQAQWSDTTPALTLNRYCASGLTAVALAAEQALACDGLAVGAGVEMMSRVPMASDRGPLTHDPEFARQARLVPIGLAADAVATLEGFSRQQCDAYALSSHAPQMRGRAATSNRWCPSIWARKGASCSTKLHARKPRQRPWRKLRLPSPVPESMSLRT